jgi:hypothetical protein
MTEIGHGAIIKYSYLWAREYDGGEETGRKTRPTCVMVTFMGPDRRKNTLLFAITSQPPRADRLSVEVPATEARRGKLRQPAWVIVSEFNLDDPTTSFALDDIEPIGQFSRKFMSVVAAAAADAIRAGRSRSVPRK